MLQAKGIIKTSLVMIGMTLSLSGNVYAVGRGARITYEGKDAGVVVFDGTVHAAKGLTCANCHEAQGILPALFEMKQGASWITMKKIMRGRSCGYCHEVSEKDYFVCSKCHNKEGSR